MVIDLIPFLKKSGLAALKMSDFNLVFKAAQNYKNYLCFPSFLKIKSLYLHDAI